MYWVPAAAPTGEPEVVSRSTGGAVTSTVAVVVAGVAWSALSARDTAAWSGPEARGEISTVAVTLPSEVPALIGAALEVQVSTVLEPLSAQLQPLAVGAALNVSPAGRVAARVGSL